VRKRLPKNSDELKAELDKEMNEYWVKGGDKSHAMQDLDKELEEYQKAGDVSKA
jgi:hypothetical protein